MARHAQAAAISARSSGARFQRIWIKAGSIFRSLVRGPFQRTARTTAKRVLRQVVRKLSPTQPGLPHSTWRLDRDAGGDLRLGGKKLEGLLERYGSPVHVVDGARLKENAARFIARPLGAPLRYYRLTGPTCTLGDTLYPFVELPELKLGDGLAIMDWGAYFVSYSTCFSFPRPAVVLVEDGRDHVLRRAETFEDMVALDGPLAGAG